MPIAAWGRRPCGCGASGRVLEVGSPRHLAAAARTGDVWVVLGPMGGAARSDAWEFMRPPRTPSSERGVQVVFAGRKNNKCIDIIEHALICLILLQSFRSCLLTKMVDFTSFFRKCFPVSQEVVGINNWLEIKF